MTFINVAFLSYSPKDKPIMLEVAARLKSIVWHTFLTAKPNGSLTGIA